MKTTPRAKRTFWERYSGGALLGMAVFAVLAAGTALAFARAAMDGEARREARLVQILQPDYVGENRLAPDFTLRDKDGRSFRLSSLRGKTVVLHFWSRDCPPCVREMAESLPAFDEIARGRKDLVLVTVSVDSGWDAVAPLVPADFRAPVLFDPTHAVVEGKYGTRLFPETWVIDPRGVIRARFDHVLEWDSAALVEYVTSFR